jgi:hypothetical protein
MHAQLIAAVWAREPATNPIFAVDGLRSFRAEQKLPQPSLQLVIATLLTGRPTNHLDLRATLGQGRAAPFLCYTVAS